MYPNGSVCIYRETLTRLLAYGKWARAALGSRGTALLAICAPNYSSAMWWAGALEFVTRELLNEDRDASTEQLGEWGLAWIVWGAEGWCLDDQLRHSLRYRYSA